MKQGIALWVLLLACLAAQAGAVPVAVTVTSEGSNRFRIALETVIPAPQNAVWNVLTDYNHHVDFLPYMSKSRIVGKKDPALIVEQEGRIRVLFWTFTLQVTQEVYEMRPGQMRFRAIAGDFTRLEGTWRLAAEGSATRLACDFVVQPKRRVPAWAVRFTARHYLSRMLQSLADHAAHPS